MGTTGLWPKRFRAWVKSKRQSRALVQPSTCAQFRCRSFPSSLHLELAPAGELEGSSLASTFGKKRVTGKDPQQK